MSRAVRGRFAALAALLLLLGACSSESGPPALPDPAAAAARYGEEVRAEVRGNLLEVRVPISSELLRGGRIWARSGPYFYLFSTATRDLFTEYEDLAGIRAVTEDADGTEIARATLARGNLSEFQWREALNTAALAQERGTERPRLLEDLIHLGEDNTEYEYAPGPANP